MKRARKQNKRHTFQIHSGRHPILNNSERHYNCVLFSSFIISAAASVWLAALSLSAIFRKELLPPNRNGIFSAQSFFSNELQSREYFFIILIVVLAFLAGYLYRKNNGNGKPVKGKGTAENSPHSTMNPQSAEELQIPHTGIHILFFENLRIISGTGEDIAAKLTPKLKQLFILLTISSIDFKTRFKGITTEKLNTTLWPDHPRENVKNNRNVSINHLRSLLDEIGGIEIVYNKNLWYVSFDDSVRFDLMDYFKLKESFMKSDDPRKDMKNLLNLIGKGKLLDDCNFDWLDNYKIKIHEDIVSFLLKAVQMVNNKMDDDELLSAAQVILKYDTLNEFAMQLKIRQLLKLGKTKAARDYFITYTNEYKDILGQNYKQSFEKIKNNGLFDN